MSLAGPPLKLTCVNDQTIEVYSGRVRIEQYVDHPHLDRLCYRCPACKEDERKALSDEQWAYLIEHLPMNRICRTAHTIPTGVLDQLASTAPAIDADDLLDLMLYLRQMDSVEA
jgi:hypothetical protein